jgi:hypothetical protein
VEGGPGGGSGIRRVRQWVIRHRLVLATGLAASLPVIVSALHAVAAGWVPLGDNAVIAARSYDVLTGHTPLLGQYSLSSGLAGGATYSPGPLEYWLLALPARFLDPRGLAVVVAIVNVGAVMGVVALAKRRGGLPLMFATGAAVALLCSSVGSESLHSIWNPAASLLPFTLLVFLCWSLACGDFRLLPLTVVVTSFVVQCHLAYVVPAVGLLAVALIGLAASRRATPWHLLRRWVLAAVLLAVVCWSAPLVEQAIHRPGNLVLLARSATADQPRLGASAGWHALVRGVGVPPWWLRDPQPPGVRLLEVGGKPAALSVVSCLVILGGLCLVTLMGLRRGRRDVVTAGCAALAVCAALALVAASTPRGTLVGTLEYTIRWGGAVGMSAWLVLGWGLGTLWRPRALRTSLPSLAGVGAVAAVGAAVAAATGADVHEPTYRPVRSVSARLDTRLGRGDTVLIVAPSGSASGAHRFDVETASVYALRRQGIDVNAPSMSRLLGGWYGERDRRQDHVLRIGSGQGLPPTGRLIARVRPPTTPSAARRRLGVRPEPAVALVLLSARSQRSAGHRRGRP